VNTGGPPTTDRDQPDRLDQARARPLPPGTRLRADPSLRRRDAGRLLIGGSPLRFVRITGAGAAIVTSWLAGEPVADSAGSSKLARRLIDAGMLHPEPPPVSADPLPELTVVIPVKDDPTGLATTLDGLPDVEVIVVDDGSQDPVRVEAVVRSGGSGARCKRRVVRRDAAGGPGLARQCGLTLVSTALVAFIDAGVETTSTTLVDLGRWFADPEIVAVGPRVASVPGTDRLSRYEQRRSPLDLGPSPAAVGGESPVTYLPTACLLARTEAVNEVGGFDPALRWGEDVDLVWRLLDHGHVRYDPTIVVHHPPRPSLQAFVRQRIGYGSAAGPLAKKHGSRLAPVRMSGWSLACWALVLSGRGRLGLALAAGTTVALRRKLESVLPDPGVEAVLLAGKGHWYAGRNVVGAATRAWWPATMISYLLGARRPARRAVALSLLGRLVFDTDGRPGDRLADVALGVVDDAAYGTGVWLSSIRTGSLDPLLPKLSEWPEKDG